MIRTEPALVPAGFPGAIYWLALGAFAIATEGFMIAPLLPGSAHGFGIRICIRSAASRRHTPDAGEAIALASRGR